MYKIRYTIVSKGKEITSEKKKSTEALQTLLTGGTVRWDELIDSIYFQMNPWSQRSDL